MYIILAKNPVIVSIECDEFNFIQYTLVRVMTHESLLRSFSPKLNLRLHKRTMI